VAAQMLGSWLGRAAAPELRAVQPLPQRDWRPVVLPSQPSHLHALTWRGQANSLILRDFSSEPRHPPRQSLIKGLEHSAD